MRTGTQQKVQTEEAFCYIAGLKAQDGSFRFPWLWREMACQCDCHNLARHYYTYPSKPSDHCEECPLIGYVLIEAERTDAMLRVVLQEGLEVRIGSMRGNHNGLSVIKRNEVWGEGDHLFMETMFAGRINIQEALAEALVKALEV